MKRNSLLLTVGALVAALFVLLQVLFTVREGQSAVVTTDDLQEAVDLAAWVRFDHPRLMLEAGRGRRDPFAPLGFAGGIAPIDSLHPTPFTEFLAVRASIQVLPGLRLSGWYFDPLVGGGDFEPPHHARVSATFQSKFWRVFPNGRWR